MRLRNDERNFGVIAQAMHWSVAALVLSLLPIGFYMSDLPLGFERFRYVEVHKSLGLAVLALMIGRTLWRFFNPPPALPSGLPVWEYWAARLTHYAIYAVLFLQAAIGMGMVWAANSPLTFFGWFALPSPISPNPAIKELAKESHELLAFAIIILVAIHIGAALRHHFVLKNDILRRMLPGLALAIGLYGATDARAATWNLQSDSQLLFHFVQSGVQFTGNFKRFEARIEFDPDKPEAGRIHVGIDIASLDTQNSERDTMLRSAELFNAEKWPQAIFTADTVQVRDPGQYEARGTLTIRDITRPLSLPFTLKIGKVIDGDGDMIATAGGEITISRRDFGLGQGQWAATDIVADEVKIEIKIQAIQQQ